MKPVNRRHFVQSSALATASLAAPALVKSANAPDKINLAFIGPGGMGSSHVKTFCQRSDMNFSWVCDVDSKRAEVAAKTIKDLTGQTVKTT